MPTLTFTTSPLSASARRRIAMRLTRWFERAGAEPAHVVIRFIDAPAGTLFSGGIPLELLPRGESELHHAAVVVQLGPHRDESFRQELAGEIAAALGLHPDTPFLYIEFRVTSPGDVLLARRGRLVGADDRAMTERMPTR